MNKTATLFLIFGLSLGLTAASATAEAGMFGRMRGRGAVRRAAPPAMCVPTTCESAGKDCGAIDDGCGGTLECGTCSGIDTCGGGGQANVCGQTCYRFAYLTEGRDGIQDVFSGGNCIATPENKTHNSVPVEHSHLTSGRGQANVAFLQTYPEGDTSGETEWMNLMDMARGSWNLLDEGSPEIFDPKAVAWDASGRLAILSKENDGAYALRLNDGPYYTADRSVLVQRFGMVPPQDMEWVPIPGARRSRHLIVSFGSFLTKPQLYVLDTEAAPIRPIDLEEALPGASYLHAMIGAQPALRGSGTEMLFIRGGRILSCDLDLSHMDDRHPRAYCSNSREPDRLRMLDGQMASPSVSHDDQWLFFSMKNPPTAENPNPKGTIFRSRFDRPFLTPLAILPGIDVKEIVSLAPWYEVTAQTAQSGTMTVREEPEYYVASTVYQANFQVIRTSCKTDADCASGQACEVNVCRPQ